MRYAEISRKTNETDIKLTLELDGKGIHDIKTGCGFLDHMLELFTSHGRFNIKLSCKGDTHVDFHHTVEDVGISLGQAFKNALGNKKGIARYGSFILPMDETLILSAIDFSGRVFLNYDVEIFTPKVGDFDTELSKEFWLGFARESFSTMHIKKLSGENSHHIIEAIFKSTARAIRQAVKFDPDYENEIPSTKGII